MWANETEFIFKANSNGNVTRVCTSANSQGCFSSPCVFNLHPHTSCYAVAFAIHSMRICHSYKHFGNSGQVTLSVRVASGGDVAFYPHSSRPITHAARRDPLSMRVGAECCFIFILNCPSICQIHAECRSLHFPTSVSDSKCMTFCWGLVLFHSDIIRGVEGGPVTDLIMKSRCAVQHMMVGVGASKCSL